MDRIKSIQTHLTSKDFKQPVNYESIKAKFGTLKNKTILISGASRGIGLAIAKRAAIDGANIVILAKTDTPHPKLPGTIHTAADEIRKLGGKALPIKCDIRYDNQVKDAVDSAVKHFGGIDVLINNASAIKMKSAEDMTMKEYDLIQSINVRGTFMLSKACLPHLKNSKNGHIIVCSPPLKLTPEYIGASTGYLISKAQMSMIVMGLSDEYENYGIGVNALWPRTTIATAAVQYELGGDAMMRTSRTEEIQADSAYEIMTADAKKCTGNLFIDDDVLRAVGVKDFSKYRMKGVSEDQLTIII